MDIPDYPNKREVCEDVPYLQLVVLFVVLGLALWIVSAGIYFQITNPTMNAVQFWVHFQHAMGYNGLL